VNIFPIIDEKKRGEGKDNMRSKKKEKEQDKKGSYVGGIVAERDPLPAVGKCNWDRVKRV